MFVWIAAAAALSFYFFAIPVKLALVLRLSARPGFGAGACVFEGRFALRKAGERARGEKKHLPWRRAGLDLEKSNALNAFRKGVGHLLKHMQLESLRAQGFISAPDAARTAIICACAHSLEGALSSLVPSGCVQLRLQPDFSSMHSDVSICGMVSVPLGHIILAALICAWSYLTRRILSHGKASH